MLHKAEQCSYREAEHGSTWAVIGHGQGMMPCRTKNEIRSVMEPILGYEKVMHLSEPGGLGVFLGFWANALVLPTNSNEATRGITGSEFLQAALPSVEWLFSLTHDCQQPSAF